MTEKVDHKIKVDTKVKDALDHIRTSVQELHAAISDAAAKRGGAVKADIETISPKAKAVAESVKGSIAGQNEATRKHLTDAVASLEATQKHAAEALKSSGHALQAAIQHALESARASTQNVSEAIAAKRSAETAHHKK